MTDPKATAEMVRRRTGLGGRDGVTDRPDRNAVPTSTARRRSRSCPWPGFPSSGPATTWPPPIAAAAPWLRRRRRRGGHQQGGVQVRGPARRGTRPTPRSGMPLRRKLVDDEAVRVLARKGRTLITENRIGLVQAAAGVDGSNVDRAELALLPVDPDASAAALRAGLRERLGVTVARRHHRHDGPGLAQRPDRRRHRRGGPCRAARLFAARVDAHGNELVVTEIAVADEIAAAADLVKGKLTAHAGGGGARAGACTDDGSNGPAPAARRRGGPVLARHRRSHRTGPPARPSCCAGRCAGSADEPVPTGAGRGRRRRGADRAGPAPHPARAVRLAARRTPPASGCWTR